MSRRNSFQSPGGAGPAAVAFNRALRDACALTLSRQFPRPVFVHPAVAQSMVGFGEYRGKPWVFSNQIVIEKNGGME